MCIPGDGTGWDSVLRDQSTMKNITFNIQHLTRPFKYLGNFLLYVKCYLLNERGFTLVEILVAATIIGLLSTIGMSGFQAITKSGRDALRKSDMEQIRSALEIYKSENNTYPLNAPPGASSCNPDQSSPDGLTSNYIKYPSDPKNTLYKYCYIAGSAAAPVTSGPVLTYELCVHLENGSNTASSGFCGDAAGVICDLNLTDSTAGNCNYQVTNP